MLLHSDKYCVKFSFQAFSKIITLMSHQSKEVDLTLFDPSKDSEVKNCPEDKQMMLKER